MLGGELVNKEKKEAEASKMAKEAAQILRPFKNMDEEVREGLKHLENDLASSHAHLLPEDFSWAELYELTFPQLLMLGISMIGMRQELLDLLQNPLTALTFAETIDERLDGYEAHLTKHWTHFDLLAVLKVLRQSVECRVIEGKTINDFVKEVRDTGNINSLCKAVLYDSVALYCPSIKKAMTQLIMKRENQTLKKIASNIRMPQKAGRRLRLRVSLNVAKEFGLLNDLTQMAKEQLFVEELKLYEKSPDSMKTLNNFIYNWMNKNPPSVNIFTDA